MLSSEYFRIACINYIYVCCLQAIGPLVLVGVCFCLRAQPSACARIVVVVSDQHMCSIITALLQKRILMRASLPPPLLPLPGGVLHPLPPPGGVCVNGCERRRRRRRRRRRSRDETRRTRDDRHRRRRTTRRRVTQTPPTTRRSCTRDLFASVALKTLKV